ncbi:MAG: methionine--tRNA ligase [Candidatus Kerfeldbacteria bacterium RIFCSPHIGHO2_12_FULL_48_17]|uniref:Methionine--tRNA ligase n=1 Tax=Candidatus Kerfeldbacteria bacterium RIFCSPHIGHO2_12_FULL_48_17 TaxID=1798542 RepID=A0A1G2B7H9_9BACT|nr:MAG: methionine--tRNA ligase [Candidatus Kerfeldbacteria bacterium RIFCSPHIGHO2_12_FULL_48_17]
MKPTFYVTTPIYYVNDKPHIGHAYSTLLADCLSRWHGAQGEETFFSVGTDEHGAKIAEAAAKAGKKPEVFVDEVSAEFQTAWKALNIEASDFIRTTEERHKTVVVSFMNKLKADGHVYEGEYEGMYCVGCERFYTERELNEKGECPDHKRKPKLIKEKNWFFKLQPFVSEIIRDIESGKMEMYPEKRKNEVLSVLRGGIEDFSVSRQNVAWGIPLPFDTKQNIYVWVEALQNYISVLGYNADEAHQGANFKKFWPANVQVLGKDISKFHCIFWPALLKAAGLRVSKRFLITGFFTVDGQKMSKTLGNVIDPNDLVAKFGADGARYLILAQFAVGEDGDIKAEKFVEKYNADLANNIGNLVSRVATMATKYCAGVVAATKFRKNIGEYKKSFAKAMEQGQVYDAIEAVIQCAASVNKAIEVYKPWEKAKDEAHSSELKKMVSTWVGEVAEIGTMLAPFTPEAAAKITQAFADPNHIHNPGILFPKIK